jgi:hypothetical protein
MPFDEAERDSIRALRDQVLTLCRDHRGDLCAQALLEALVNVLHHSSSDPEFALEQIYVVMKSGLARYRRDKEHDRAR